MVSILKATSTMRARALKLSFETAMEVRSKLEYLNKDHADKGVEEAHHKYHKSDWGKGKALEDAHKKRKLIHNSGSFSVKYGTTVSHLSKVVPPPPKLMEFTMKR